MFTGWFMRQGRQTQGKLLGTMMKTGKRERPGRPVEQDDVLCGRFLLTSWPMGASDEGTPLPDSIALEALGPQSVGGPCH